jgi:hypothetical protein
LFTIYKILKEEIMSNGFDKMSLSGPGVTHLDLAAHGTVSLSRCNINNQARYANQRTLCATFITINAFFIACSFSAVIATAYGSGCMLYFLIKNGEKKTVLSPMSLTGSHDCLGHVLFRVKKTFRQSSMGIKSSKF